MKRIRVPSCCKANRTHGFIRATETFDGDTGKTDPNGEWGRKWEATLVDARGVPHTIETTRCPACGAYVAGLSLFTMRQRVDRRQARV